MITTVVVNVLNIYSYRTLFLTAQRLRLLSILQSWRSGILKYLKSLSRLISFTVRLICYFMSLGFLKC